RAALIAILQDADVFITNVRPGALKRARLDYDSVKAELPRLIYANVTGYGLTGEDADTPAFDLTGFWNRSGVAHAINPPDREPIGSRPGFGDHVTALATLSGVLAAVHERDRTGQGRQVETALMRVGAYALAWDMSIRLRNGEALTAQPRHARRARPPPPAPPPARPPPPSFPAPGMMFGSSPRRAPPPTSRR